MEEAQPKRVLLCLRHRNGRSLGIIEAVHGVQLHDHVQAVGQHQHHEKTGHQTHPDTSGEEACTVAGIRELTAAQVKALYLYRRKKQQQKIFISPKTFHLKLLQVNCRLIHAGK